MVSANRVILAGNLTRDPIIRKAASGIAVANVSLAISEYSKSKDGESNQSTCFVDVVVWDKQAQACADYLTKGSAVLIEGRLQFDSWLDADGETRNKLKVKADRVQFLNPRSDKPDEGPDQGAEPDP